jgi:hypothetical protein
VIDGTGVRWGALTIRADDVTAVGYSAINRSFTVRFATVDGELRFKLTGRGAAEREIEAWRSLVGWFERYVEPRLIDERLAEMRATGGTQLGRTTFGWDGITTHRGLLTWDEFAGTAFTGVQVTCIVTRTHSMGTSRRTRSRPIWPAMAPWSPDCAARSCQAAVDLAASCALAGRRSDGLGTLGPCR